MGKPKLVYFRFFSSVFAWVLCGLLFAVSAYAQNVNDKSDVSDTSSQENASSNSGPAQPLPPEAAAPSTSLFGKRVVAIEVEGNKRIEADAVRAAVVTKVGNKLTPSRVRQDVRAIWRMGFFADVSVTAADNITESSDGVVITYVLTEKPSVRRIYVGGNDKLGLDKINDELDLELDAILDINEVEENRQKIQDLYVKEGYYLAAVSYAIEPYDTGEVDLTFRVTEGDKVAIREVSFVGNVAIPDAELRNVIATRKKGALSFMTDTGTFDDQIFGRDLAIIQAYYWDKGYVNVKIGSPRLRLSADKTQMYIAVPISEGPVFAIDRISFKGELIATEEAFVALMGIDSGNQFSRTGVGLAIERLTNYYKNKGYAYVDITPLNSVDPEARKVSLTFDIKQGEKVYVERINIRGNSKTRDKVIRREVKIAEGDLYHQGNIDVSKGRVTSLGFFESVDVSTRRGTDDKFVIINIEVAERPTGTFQIGAGFSSVENFIAQAQISQNNLFGRGQTLALQAQLSSLRQLFLLRFSDPYFFDTRWNFGFDLYNQSRSFDTFARESVGGSLTWGRPLSWESRVFLTYRLEDVGVTTQGNSFTSFGGVSVPVESQSVANLFRGGLTSSLRLQVSYDSRNDRVIRATKGWFNSAFVEVADASTGSENVFLRYGGFVRHYKKLWGPFTWKFNGELGVVTSRDPLGVPIIERYLVGGIFDIRGFRPRSLGPILRVSQPGQIGQELGRLPLGGNMQVIINNEVEFPIFQKVNIFGVVFLDVGNAYNLEDRYCTGTSGATEISPKFDPCFRFPESLTQGLRRSLGFGFRWISPIGPLRFEWGIPLDRQLNVNEDSLVFEFTIGNFF